MPPALLLPSPPDEAQKWAYFGSQSRWVMLLLAVASVCGIGSLVRFALSDLVFLSFLVPAVISAVTAAISFVSSVGRRRTDRASHEERVASWSPARLPSIDVFLPTAGEDLAVLANTYHHVARMQWPVRGHQDGTVRVYVLDDAASPHVRALAERHGFTYLVRPDRGRLKKAGNLAFGYSRSGGEFIVIFDADFAPRVDFLTELLPYFEDKSVGIVQSPQYFDADPRQNWLQRTAGSTQELFYRWIQPARDSVGAAICVGTNAVYRRAALAAAGGFAQIGHSEDVHTGIKVQRAGFTVRYVPVNVAKGICPDDMRGFINQQYRWCAGSMSLMTDRAFHRADLRMRQRLCYFSGFGYYVTTALASVLSPLPMLLMLWFRPAQIEPSHYALVLPAVALSLLTQSLVHHTRWEPEVLRVQAVYAYAHLLAVVHALRGRHDDWVPTGVGGRTRSNTATTVNRMMRSWTALTQLAMWIGLFQAGVAYGWAHFWPAILLACYSSYLHVPLLLPRHALTLPSVRTLRQQRRARAVIEDGLEKLVVEPAALAQAWPRPRAVVVHHRPRHHRTAHLGGGHHLVLGPTPSRQHAPHSARPPRRGAGCSSYRCGGVVLDDRCACPDLAVPARPSDAPHGDPPRP